MLTVFTSTYNRAELLTRLYRSLLVQTSNQFQWLIIDDCSSDNTKQIVEEWIKDNQIDIIYHQNKENLGLLKNINKAYEIVDTEWIVKVDSDDFLLEHAIEFIYNKLSMHHDNNFLGIGALFLKPNGDLMYSGQSTPPAGISAKFYERDSYGFCIDCIEVHNVKIRKKYPIPTYKSYIGSERISFSLMANAGYYMQWFTTPIAVVNYQTDGMTATTRTMRNPMEEAITFNYYQSFSFYDLKTRIYYASEFIYWTLKAKEYSYLLHSQCITLLPVGLLLGVCKVIKRRKTHTL